ncbi:MAG TPA: hypothetical protein VLS48_02490 [Anaerolineales bacterium]|nr:hypothetical protein [Anaerolineales bacterium]
MQRNSLSTVSQIRPKLKFGLATMHHEQGERRAFLPDFVGALEKNGAQVMLEHGYGSGMGVSEVEYRNLAPGVVFASHEEVYQQDYVLVLRCPSDEDLCLLHPGACLISMLHYPTRPQRVAFLRERGLEAISLDSIKDDSGRRIVENLKAVAWNGMEIAFQELRKTYPTPGFDSPRRDPIHVTLMGAGAVGVHVVQAAIRYADPPTWLRLAEEGIPGVQVTVIDFDTTRIDPVMRHLLARTDILVDATQRPNPSQPVIPNAMVAYLPEHAIVLDLSVDPYNCDQAAISTKGVEGIPQGNLDQYVFAPQDPAYDNIPACFGNEYRRTAVSCYSWPGIHPKKCMQVYGRQLRPVMRTLLEKGGVDNITPEGRFFERAIARAKLSSWES